MFYMSLNYYFCDGCGKEIFEADYYYSDNNGYDLCNDCAFILNKWTEKEYLSSIGCSLGNLHAAIKENKIVLWCGNKIPYYKRTDKKQRHSIQYETWRTSVYKRDNYTCQDCNKRGGKLNAHHLNSFKFYPNERYNIENGITLCMTCHRLRHKTRKVI